MLDLRELAQLCERHGDALDAEVRQFEIGGHRFSGHPDPALMGVVNLSADSWYRESVCLSADRAIERGRQLIADGAVMIDIGAESTLLDAQRISGDRQLQKLLPVVEALAASGAVVSVESYDLTVAEACLKHGARVINLTAAKDTEEYYRLAHDHEAGVVACYLQGGDNVRAVGDFVVGEDHTAVLYDYFSAEAERAGKVGLERLWFDPGLGFYYRNLTDSAERVSYQMQSFLNAFRLRTIGWPICQALPHAFEYFAEEVRSAEGFFAVLALLGKIDLIRTHEVSRVRGVMRTMAAFQNG